MVLDNTHEDLITISSDIIQISNERMELRLLTDHVGSNKKNCTMLQYINFAFTVGHYSVQLQVIAMERCYPVQL